MTAQVVLEDKKSTYGGPYGYYTVTLTPAERAKNSVKVKFEVSAHLAENVSYTKLGVSCTLRIGGEAHTLTLVPYGEEWRGTGVRRKNVTFTVTGLDITQTKISGITFSALEGGGPTSGPSLSATNCADLLIDRYGGIAHIGKDGRDALPWVKSDGAWHVAVPWGKDREWKVGV